MNEQLVRLQKYISQCGFCSRRAAEILIANKRVYVNGKIAAIGTTIEVGKDQVKIDNKVITPKNDRHVYIALNKPIGHITSTTNAQGDSVLDLISDQDRQNFGRIFPVGRLDKDSSGLVLLTNDGELTNLLTHPSFEHEKEYAITISCSLDPKDEKVLTNGLKIKGQALGGMTIKEIKKQGKRYVVIGILKEGKNRQIRKMFGNLGYDVLNLQRVRLGKLCLGDLKNGRYRLVKKQDIL